ncbi:MAG: hypothetical protein AAF677_02300 [Pseudomonadota bacterium]
MPLTDDLDFRAPALAGLYRGLIARRRALRLRAHAQTVTQFEETSGGAEFEGLQLALETGGRRDSPRVTLKLWEDRLLWLWAGRGSRSGWIWTWEDRGRLAGGLAPARTVALIEQTLSVIGAPAVPCETLTALWSPVLCKGPRLCARALAG